MQRDKREKQSKKIPGVETNALGARSKSIDNIEYEERFRELAENEKQLTEKIARLANLCQYFSERRIDVPTEIIERISGLSKLTIPERVRALVEVNQALMEYLDTIGDLRSRQ